MILLESRFLHPQNGVVILPQTEACPPPTSLLHLVIPQALTVNRIWWGVGGLSAVFAFYRLSIFTLVLRRPFVTSCWF